MQSFHEQLDEIKNEEKRFKEASPKLSRFNSFVSTSNFALILILVAIVISISIRVWQNDESHRSTGELIWHILGTLYFGLLAIGFLIAMVTENVKAILQYIFKVPAYSHKQFLSSIEGFSKRKKIISDNIKKGKKISKPVKSLSVTEAKKSTEVQTPDDLIYRPSTAHNKSTLENNITTDALQSIKAKPFIPAEKQEEQIKPVEVPKSSEEKKITVLKRKQTSEIKIVNKTPITNINKEIKIPKEEEKTSSELFSTNNPEVVKQESVKTHQPKPSVKIDFPKLNEHRHNIGELGELYIFQKEQNHLISQGKIILSKGVTHVSLKSDSEGYDIVSFTDTGDRKYIEVKTTTGNEFEPFYLSSSEMNAMKRLNNYWIYRVYNFNIDLKIGDLFKIDCKKEFDRYYHIQASSFKVIPKK